MYVEYISVTQSFVCFQAPLSELLEKLIILLSIYCNIGIDVYLNDTFFIYYAFIRELLLFDYKNNQG